MSELVERRSIVFYERNTDTKLLVEDFDLNAYTKDEIVIKVKYASFNPIDYILYKFAYRLITNKTQAKTFGRDFSGEIIKVGSNVAGEKFAVGDKIVGLFEHGFTVSGTMSDYLVLNPNTQKAIAKVNEDHFSLSPETSSWPLVFGTSFQALTSHELKLTDWENQKRRVLIVGASTSTGVAAVQIAKQYLGAEVVDGICSGSSFERNKKFGFDTLFDYKSEDVKQDVIEHVKKSGQKYDVIYDCCGNSYFFDCMTDVLKPKSEKSYYTTIAGDNKMFYGSPDIPNIFGLFKKFLSRSYVYHYTMLAADEQWIKAGVEMNSKGTFKMPVDSVFKPDEYQKAFDILLSNKTKGKLVIDFSS